MDPFFYSRMNDKLLSVDITNGGYEASKLIGTALITTALCSQSLGLSSFEKSMVVGAIALPVLFLWGLSYHATIKAQTVLEASNQLPPVKWKHYALTGLKSVYDVPIAIVKAALIMVTAGFTLLINARIDDRVVEGVVGLVMVLAGILDFLMALISKVLIYQASDSERAPLL